MAAIDIAGELRECRELRGDNGILAAELQKLDLGLVYATRARANVEDVARFGCGGEGCPQQALAGIMYAERREEELSQSWRGRCSRSVLSQDLT
jgi:hypothetical protein